MLSSYARFLSFRDTRRAMGRSAYGGGNMNMQNHRFPGRRKP